MLITLLITCCIVRGIQSHLESGHFTIVAPGTIRSNSEYHVSLSLDNFTQTCWFNISLETSSDGFTEVFSRVTVEVEPKTTKLVKMQLPKLYYGYGLFRLIGYRGIICDETARISIEERQYSVYIQTNKSKYKPGELMQFRVIFIDRLTRPAEIDEVIDVHVYDGEKNLIRKFSDVKLVQGVFRGDLQLSDHVVLGAWAIELSAGGAILENELFEVARYVLPKFSVQIDMRKNVAVNEEKMVIHVKSGYTYGQPVRGNLTINVKPVYAPTRNSTVIKSDEFEGETTIWLDFNTDLDISRHLFEVYNKEYFTYIVTATVTEALTDQSHNTTSEIRVHSQPYIIKVDAPQSFEMDDLVNITVSITDLQGHPIKDLTNPVGITVKSSSYDFTKLMSTLSDFENFEFGVPVEIEISVYLNESGAVVATLKLPKEETFSEYDVTANYLGYNSHSTTLKRNYLTSLILDVLTKRPMVGNELLIELRSTEPFDYFIYEIVSRGDIIQSQRINVPDKNTTYLLKLNATYAMVPKITLFVHRIKNGILNSRLKEVYIKRVFQNSINITTEEELNPGAFVSLNVTTDESSYVGLMGIDARLLLDPDYKTSLTEDNIYTAFRNYDSMNIDDELYPGGEAGLITFSNSRSRGGEVIGHRFIIAAGVGAYRPLAKPFDKPSVEMPRIRRLFAESWLFKDFKRTPKEGLKLNEVIPDTITSWAISGFSLNPKTGFALTRNAIKLKAFQPFFISVDLPRVAKEGEIIEVPVYVSNYMEQDLLTNVTIKIPNGDLDIFDKLTSESRVQHNQTFSKSISTNGREKFVFLIKPRKSGRYNLTIKAMSPLASDAVEKTLIVESDGVPYSISKTYLIHLLADSQDREDDILVEIPENTVSGSESVQLSVVGDLFVPLMRSLDGLVRVPFGNSESNMKYFVSNLLVLKYLKTTNNSNSSLGRKAKLYLQLGYQTQLAFSQLDGSFSLFDRAVDMTGDTRLTAYTMWALQQAKDFIQIDSKVLDRGLSYLKSQQVEHGGFSSGKNLDEDVALTALILLAFLVENKIQIQYQDVMSKGLQYLYDILDDLEQETVKAVSIYALALGKHDKSGELLEKLKTPAILKSKQLQWAKSDNLPSNIEITAYTFMTLLESQEMSLETLYPILRSLILAGQDKSTPAHMMALEGMVKLAQRIHFGTTNLNIHFEDDQGESGDLLVNSSNAQVLQQVKLKNTSRNIRLRTRGRGFSLISLNYKYNILPENQTSSNYEANVTLKEFTGTELVMDVCVAKHLYGSKSNLTIMEVNFQSGYSVYEDGFDGIRENNEHVKFIELMESGQSVRVYFKNVTQNGTCIQLGSTKTIRVHNSKPISIVVHDVENEYQRTVLYYTVNPEREM